MIELPEALSLARQCDATIRGKRISGAEAAHSPHKFASYHGNPQDYSRRLAGKTIGSSRAFGGIIEISVGDLLIILSDGVGLRYHAQGEQRPAKHQLLVEFDDGSAITVAVQMYGGITCCAESEISNPYILGARKKPPVLSAAFDRAWFDSLMSPPEAQKLSAKAFLATEQRIPGLGNGVLQDILWRAKIHPKTRMKSLSDDQKSKLFETVKSLLSEMAERGGRDTEIDLFGRRGGYKTVMSSINAGNPCPDCGGAITKDSYMGGSIHFCATCQEARR